MAVSTRLRYEIFRRDSHTCRYCGVQAPDAPLTVDHVVPVALGGSDEATNLVTACRDCNAGKTSTNPDAPLVGDVTVDALRWRDAIEWAVKQRRAEMINEDGMLSGFDATWGTWHYGRDKKEVPRPSDWRDSILQFAAAGLDDDDFERYIQVAMNKANVDPAQTWTYFCGCCWRALDDIQKRARALLDKVPF